MNVASVQTAQGTAGAAPEPRTYTVRAGDTLSGVAAAHGVSLRALEAANPQVLHPDLIRPGQVLHVPESGGHAAAAPQAYTVRPGDTLSGIGERFGVNWRILAQANGVTDPQRLRVGTELRIGGVGSPPRTAPTSPRPATLAAPAGGSTGAQRTQGTGLPSTAGLSEAQKVGVYSDYVNTYGDAHARADLAAGRQVILGLRHETNTHANGGGGAYDDRIVVVSRTGVQEFRANTEPSSRYEGRYGSDADGDGRRDLGQLAEGSSRFARSSSGHLGEVLRPTGPVAIERDVNHDGRIAAGEGRGSSTDQSFLFHAGGNTITGSAGCQTMAPGDFSRFWSGLSAGQRDFSYMLVDADRHGVGSGSTAAAAPSGATPGGSARPATPVAAVRAGSHTIPAEVIAGAQAAQTKWGVPAAVTIAQWSIESGWGRHMPTGSNNPFGIKAVGDQPYVTARTREEVNGRSVYIDAHFRKFDSMSQAFDEHGRLLAQGSAYAQARTHLTDPDAYADALTHHYATDSQYGATLKSQMRAYDLYRFD